MDTIVVGVDGSDESKKALRWAYEEARLRGTTLKAVYAWLHPGLAGPGFVPPFAIDVSVLRRDAEELLERIVSEMLGNEPEMTVERVVVGGSAPRVLIEAAEGAELLVVGSRGHGGFAGLLLGSVSQQCAHHAPCPIVIIRPRRKRS